MADEKIARGLPEGAQSKGGVARAKVLTAEERVEIATQAAEARWGSRNLPKATHEGPLTIGDIEIDCAVLEDGMRVLSERAVTKALGGKRGGAHWRRKKAKSGGANLPVYLSADNLSPFVSKDLAAALSAPVLYGRRGGGPPAYGLKAELLPQVLKVFLSARAADKLAPSQKHIAAQAEILIMAFAEVGIVALVDEATGYQYDRQRDALAELLKRFLSDELRRWVKTFPAHYFRELCRLRNVPYYPDMRLPPYFGHLTNDIIYKRLAPHVLEELKRLNPRDESGRRHHRHHQWLSEDLGSPKLIEHLGAVVALMKVSDSYDAFIQRLDKVAPIWGKGRLFEGLA